jgi:hypothetical protein
MWPVQAVTAGTFAICVVLVPASPTAAAGPLPVLIGTFFGLLRWRRHTTHRRTPEQFS